MIKEINKLIKPYIVKQKDGGCFIKISLKEWDKLVDETLFILLKKLFNAFPLDVKGRFKVLFK